MGIEQEGIEEVKIQSTVHAPRKSRAAKSIRLLTCLPPRPRRQSAARRSVFSDRAPDHADSEKASNSDFRLRRVCGLRDDCRIGRAVITGMAEGALTGRRCSRQAGSSGKSGCNVPERAGHGDRWGHQTADLCPLTARGESSETSIS